MMFVVFICWWWNGGVLFVIDRSIDRYSHTHTHTHKHTQSEQYATVTFQLYIYIYISPFQIHPFMGIINTSIPIWECLCDCVGWCVCVCGLVLVWLVWVDVVSIARRHISIPNDNGSYIKKQVIVQSNTALQRWTRVPSFHCVCFPVYSWKLNFYYVWQNRNENVLFCRSLL